MAAGFSNDELEALAALVGHRGWDVLREHLERQIRSDTSALVEANLDKEPHRAAVLQGQIRRAKQTLSVVDAAVRAHHAKE